MDAPEQPQIYLITPPAFELSTFPEMLARVLDTHEIACLRLALSSQDDDKISRAADACRAVAHERDVPLVIADHAAVVERLGLDGVHFTDARRSVRDARKELGGDAIVGVHAGASRHAGLEAGEAGADYVAFGPVRDTGLGADVAAAELFEWWTEMIELPVVAEGALDKTALRALAPVTDFFALGEEVWSAADPVAQLGEMIAAMSI